MSSLSQGTAGPSGRTGLQLAPVQLLSGNYATPMSTSAQLEQSWTENSISNQIRKLTVRMPVDLLDFIRADSLQAHRRNVRDITRGMIHDLIYIGWDAHA